MITSTGHEPRPIGRSPPAPRGNGAWTNEPTPSSCWRPARTRRPSRPSTVGTPRRCCGSSPDARSTPRPPRSSRPRRSRRRSRHGRPIATRGWTAWHGSTGWPGTSSGGSSAADASTPTPAASSTCPSDRSRPRTSTGSRSSSTSSRSARRSSRPSRTCRTASRTPFGCGCSTATTTPRSRDALSCTEMNARQRVSRGLPHAGARAAGARPGTHDGGRVMDTKFAFLEQLERDLQDAARARAGPAPRVRCRPPRWTDVPRSAGPGAGERSPPRSSRCSWSPARSAVVAGGTAREHGRRGRRHLHRLRRRHHRRRGRRREAPCRAAAPSPAPATRRPSTTNSDQGRRRMRPMRKRGPPSSDRGPVEDHPRRDDHGRRREGRLLDRVRQRDDHRGRAGGFVLSSSISQQRPGTLTLRIPSQQLDTALVRVGAPRPRRRAEPRPARTSPRTSWTCRRGSASSRPAAR